MLAVATIVAAASSGVVSSKGHIITRRSAFQALGGVVAANVLAPAAHAGMKFPGEQPKDLGVRPDGSLKGCPSSPNCWSTSGDAKHVINPFEFSKKKDAAVADLTSVLSAYPQEGVTAADGSLIDGGGNQIVTNDAGYVYMQFTSKRFGFVDDVEFSVQDGGKVMVRSASRQGDSDLGVNAARLKYIAAKLAEKGGWKTELGV